MSILSNAYDNPVTASIAFLRQIQMKVHPSSVDELIQIHPDYPSMLSISDVFAKWKIPHAIARLESLNIEELPLPFIAYTHNPKYSFLTVVAIDKKTVEGFSGSYSKTVIIPRDEFLQHWEGIYLIAEPNKDSGEPLYNTVKRQRLIYHLFLTILVFNVGLISWLVFRSHLPNNVNRQAIFGFYFQLFQNALGVAITLLLLGHETNDNNPLFQRVCGAGARVNCKAILTARAARLFKHLSWGEIGFFYFFGNFLSIIYNPLNPFPYWLNLIALPYTAFSIYYQGIVIKQWCLLCVSVQALLLLGAINIWFSRLLGISWLPDSSNLLPFGFIIFICYGFVICLWYVSKPLLIRLSAATKSRRELLRLKMNYEIFDALLENQKTIQLSSIEGFGIDIGNPNAINTIIKVCNPFCGPCAKAHPWIEKLIATNLEIKAKIIFTSSQQQNDINNLPAKHLLALAERQDPNLIHEALNDWYLADKKTYDVFSKKYHMPVEELQRQQNQLERMGDWCYENDIQFTPTIFINGFQLPDIYTLEDVLYIFHNKTFR